MNHAAAVCVVQCLRALVDDFDDIITDSAVLVIGGVQFTASRGGWSFEPNETWEDFDFPGTGRTGRLEARSPFLPDWKFQHVRRDR